MKYIEVKQFTPPQGKEYDATQYPGPGAYMDTTGTLRIVYAMSGAYGNHTVMTIGMVSPSLIKDSSADTAGDLSVEKGNITQIDGNTMLKMVAIMQKPDLAKELTE